MSVKRYKLAMPASSQRIKKAKKTLKEMPKLKKIDLIVASGGMTEKQAEKAKKKLMNASG
jgi:hypothetical protein